LTDFVQIAPHRSVSLAPQGSGAINVTVAGEATGRAFGPNGLLPANAIEVTVERRLAGFPDEAGWEPVAATVTPAATVPAGTLWQGTVSPPSSAGGQFRLAIREFEQLPSDRATLDRRLVFADTIPLP
jgi:hypothetical protein